MIGLKKSRNQSNGGQRQISEVLVRPDQSLSMKADRIRSALKNITPPMLWDALRAVKGRSGQNYFSGDYGRWEDAVRKSGGYAADSILAATREAMVRIRDGEAVFERDSVLLKQAEPPFPLISGLLRTATLRQGSLSVLDFGGALASTYYQCRPFLDGVPGLRWSVVEQAAHVACGRAEFSNERLRFYASVEECLAVEKPDVLLLSSVLQYLPAPYEFLAGLLRHGIPWVIVDRSAFLTSDRDRLTVQHVPDSIYSASYPAWFLSRSKFMACFQADYELLQSFPGEDKVALENGDCFFEGFIFEKSAR
jgi:putative methyltransferase (TIGR04325 family)